jgi:branched-chain amino acid transport system permease protein
LVRDGDLRQPDEEPRVLPTAQAGVSATVATGHGGVRTVRGALPAHARGVLFLGLAVAYPFVISSNQDLLDASIVTLAYVIMALGLNIVVGFAGLLDLGYVAFYVIGAFVMAWIGSRQFADVNHGRGIHILVPGESALSHQPIPGIHVNFFIVLIVAAAMTALWGAILGAPTLRLRGDYVAIVTLAFGEIVPSIFANGTSGLFGIGSLDFSNGREGITPIDKVNLPWSDEPLRYPLHLTGAYFVALWMVLVTLFVNRRLRDSRLGRAWIAMREDEFAAASMGINLVRTKLWAYAIGAAFGGFAGAFLATYYNTVNADQFEFGFSVFILCMVVVGGAGSIWGAVVGAVALSMLNRFGLPEASRMLDPVGIDLRAVSSGVFGFLLVVTMLLRPQGLVPAAGRRRRAEP